MTDRDPDPGEGTASRPEPEGGAGESRFAQFIEHAPFAVFVNQDDHVVLANPACARLLGAESPAQLLGRPIFELFPPEEHDAIRERIARLRAAGRPSPLTPTRVLRRDGRIAWADATAFLIESGGRQTIHVVLLDATDRRRYEASLRDARDHFEALITASPAAIVSIDTDGLVTFWNDGAERLFGWSASEVVGGPLPFVREPSVPESEVLRRRVLAGERLEGVELVRHRKDGAPIDVSLSTAPLVGADGAATGIMAVIEDITARKRAERGLRESEAELRAEFEHATAGRSLVSPDGRILRANRALASMLGTTPEDLVGTQTDALLHPDDRERATALGLELLAGDQDVQRWEARFLRRDGGVVWVSLGTTLLRGEDGAPSHFISDAQDVTARKVAEERYRQLIENIDDIVYLVDTTGRITFVSPAVAKFGYAVPELLGKSFLDFVHPEDRARVVEALGTRMQEDLDPIEYRVLDRNGKVRFVRSASRRAFEEGRLVGLLGVLFDLTDLRQTEAALRASQKMEAIGRLAGGVAHDFNNILTVISSYSGLAMRGLRRDDPLRADLEEIRAASDRASALTRQLLAFSRRQVLQPAVLDLNELVTGMERMLRRLIGEDVELRFVPATGLGRILADPGQTEQVLMNLVVNARDALPRGGRITIATADADLDDAFVLQHPGARTGRHVLLSVSDDGIGMDADVRERLFEPFFTTKPAGKGTGLGLATVYGIVKQSGGGIWADSAPGKGSTFRVYFPRVEDAPSQASPSQRYEPPLPGAATILLVEDDGAVRTLAQRLLAAEGHRVLAAANGSEALLLAERHGSGIDLVLTDVVMPGLSGRELADRLAPILPRARFLFMSGYSDEAISRHGVLSPGTLFLPKPFTPELLAARVREVLTAPP